jgi:uncharacterized protein YvpB
MKKYVLAFLICAGFSITAMAYESPYNQAVDMLVERGIIEDGAYEPKKLVNRAEFLKMAMFDVTDRFEVGSCFIDVDEDDWFSAISCKAKDKGIIQGYADGSFRASDKVNLAEALKILMKANQVGYDQTGQKWYNGLMEEAEKMNLIPKGVKPSDELNREQAAYILYRYILYTEGYLELKVNYEELPESFQLDVPFVSQAPFHDWSLPYAEACEEASLIMIEQYAAKAGLLEADKAAYQILELVKWQEDRNYIVDIGASEMAKIAKDYYGRDGFVYRDEEVTVENIKSYIAKGVPVIIPIAGQEIGNTYYTPPGPPYHVVVLTGYDSENFYINDPGTQFGEDLPFNQQVIMDGIHDWNGSKKTITTGPKAMLVLDI